MSSLSRISKRNEDRINLYCHGPMESLKTQYVRELAESVVRNRETFDFLFHNESDRLKALEEPYLRDNIRILLDERYRLRMMALSLRRMETSAYKLYKSVFDELIGVGS